MTYAIEIQKSALKFIGRQPKAARVRLMSAIYGLPFRGNIHPLKGRAGFRLRVGTYRIIFTRDDIIQIVSVESVGNRGDVYK
jgi:mRNA interferase RelE/StbE